MYSKDKIKDNRSWAKTVFDYNKGKEREEECMSRLCKQFALHGIMSSWEHVEDEKLADGRAHITPDTYFYADKDYTFEIKYSNTGNFHNNTVYVKPASIFSMLNNRVKYPNGHVLIGTKNKYGLLKVDVVKKYEIKPAKEMGGKKAFHIPEDEIPWRKW